MATKLIIVGFVLIVVAILSGIKTSSGARIISAKLGIPSGIIGVLIGWALSSLGGVILYNFGYGFLKPAFPLMLFVGLILFATITGAISGVYPAIKASKVNPVEALRYE